MYAVSIFGLEQAGDTVMAEGSRGVMFGMNMLLWTTRVTRKHLPLMGQLKQQGWDGVELPIFEMNVPEFTRMGKQLDGMGLARTGVTICTDDANPIGSNEKIRQAGLRRIKEAVDCCHAAGINLLCGPIHSALGKFSGKGPTKDEFTRAKDVLGKAADYAKQADVTLAIEPLNRFECYFANTTRDAAAFCRDVNHSHLKTMYDTFHSHIEVKDVSKEIQLSQDQVVHVHISENDRSTPGMGQVNWEATFTALKQVDYQGWFVVEAFGLALPALAAATKVWRRMFKDELTLTADALAFMQKCWEASDPGPAI